MDSKTRAKLRSLASHIKPSVIIGKDGIDQNLIGQLNIDLDAHELVKVSVLEDDADYKGILTELAAKTGAEGICAIGKKLVLYRYSAKKGTRHVLEVD